MGTVTTMGRPVELLSSPDGRSVGQVVESIRCRAGDYPATAVLRVALRYLGAISLNLKRARSSKGSLSAPCGSQGKGDLAGIVSATAALGIRPDRRPLLHDQRGTILPRSAATLTQHPRVVRHARSRPETSTLYTCNAAPNRTEWHCPRGRA